MIKARNNTATATAPADNRGGQMEVEMSERKEQVRRMITGLPAGQWWGSRERLFVRRPADRPDEYIVIAVQLLPEQYDEDPGRVSCGCDLAGHSHGHAERVYTHIDEAAAAYLDADEAMRARRAPGFAPMERIG